MATKRRSDHLRGEAAFLPRSVDDLAELRRRILAAGHTDQVASGIAGWLIDKAADEPDRTGPSTRSRYRKVLAELEPLHPDPDDDELHLVPAAGGRHGGRRQRGQGVRKALVALVVAGAGVVGAGVPHQNAAEASPTRADVEIRREVPRSVNQRRRRGGRGGLRSAA